MALNILEMQSFIHELALNSRVLKKQRYLIIVIKDWCRIGCLFVTGKGKRHVSVPESGNQEG